MGNKICEVPSLAHYRSAAGHTQESLAKELGVSEMTVLRWENGHNSPSLPMLRRIAAILRCSKEALLGPPPPSQQSA